MNQVHMLPSKSYNNIPPKINLLILHLWGCRPKQDDCKHFSFCCDGGASGLHCSRNWDGWLCWDDTPAGNYASQNCPDYFDDFDPTGQLRVIYIILVVASYILMISYNPSSQKRQLSSVELMENGFIIQRATIVGPTILSVPPAVTRR